MIEPARLTEATDRVADALLDVEGVWRTHGLDADEVVRLWLDLDGLRSALVELTKLVADDAAGRLTDIEGATDEYATASGDVVHLAPGYAPDRWAGRALVHELAQTYADRDGVLTWAVPVDVLLDVLPGCADADATSSKWRTTGLARHLPAWKRYRSRAPAPLTIRRGSRRT